MDGHRQVQEPVARRPGRRPAVDEAGVATPTTSSSLLSGSRRRPLPPGSTTRRWPLSHGTTVHRRPLALRSYSSSPAPCDRSKRRCGGCARRRGGSGGAPRRRSLPPPGHSLSARQHDEVRSFDSIWMLAWVVVSSLRRYRRRPRLPQQPSLSTKDTLLICSDGCLLLQPFFISQVI
jgi:hypothetical protein